MPKLIEDWKRAVWRFWSLRLMALDLLLQIGDTFVPFMRGMVPDWVFFMLLGAAMVARIVHQPKAHA